LLYGQTSPAQQKAATSDALPHALTTQESADEISNFFGSEQDEYSQRLGWNPNEYRWGSGDAAILDFRILNKEGNHTVQLYADEKYIIAMKVLLNRSVPNCVFGFYIKTIDGLLITGSNSRDFPEEQSQHEVTGQDCRMCEVSFNFYPRLASGEYMISLGVAEDVGGELAPLDRRYDSILVHIVNRKPYFGLIDLDTRCLVRKIGLKRVPTNG